MRLVLTRRALADPIHGQCGVCSERHRLEHLVVLGADELAICRSCYEAAAHFGRLSAGHPILFDLEHSPWRGGGGPAVLTSPIGPHYRTRLFESKLRPYDLSGLHSKRGLDVDPITVIMGALSLAGTLATPISDQAVKDGYAGLKSLIVQRFGKKDASLETTLAKYEQNPDVWKEPMRDVLQGVGADKDQEVVDHATELVKKAEASQPGITGGLVGQINAAGGKVTVIGGNVTTLNM